MELTTTVSPGRRTVAGGAVVGVVVTVAAIGAFIILSIQSTAELHISTYHSLYTKFDWALAAALLVSGIGLLVGTAVALRPLAYLAVSAGLVFAAQLGGAGAVAHHRWKGWFGPGQPGYGHLDELKLLSLALGSLGLLALVLLVWYLYRHDAFTPTVHPSARIALLATGAAVAVAVPWLLAIDDSVVTAKTYAGFAVLFSVTWGAGIAAVGWLDRWAAAGALGAVLGSSLVASVTDHILSVGSPGLAFGVAAVLTFVAAIVRLVGEASSG